MCYRLKKEINIELARKKIVYVQQHISQLMNGTLSQRGELCRMAAAKDLPPFPTVAPYHKIYLSS